MIKKSIGLLIFIFCFFLIYITKPYSQDEYFKYESADLIDHYFSSLQNGDTKQLLSMLTGPYKKKRQNLLENNLQYAEFVRKINADLTFEIVDMNVLDDRKIAVDIIVTRQDSIEKLKLILIREDQILKIYDEQLVP